MSALARLLPLPLLLVLAAGGAPELAPYRTLAHDPAACDSLLAAARAGLERALAPATANAAVPVAPTWPGSPRPLYVTLVHGRTTRACVGSDAPLGGSLAASLAALGERVAASDARHPPLDAGELDTLRLVVAFAGDPEPVADPYTVDPVREGLKIETDRGAIAYLPGEARTVAWALREARRAGVLAGPLSEARFSRFTAVVIQGPARASARGRNAPHEESP